MPTALTSLTHAAVRKTVSLFRSLGAAPTHPHWQTRAELCARCPLAHTHKGTTYCGRPFLQKLSRLPTDGCGCPTDAKAQDPTEHCPVTPSMEPASPHPPSTPCPCKWCSAGL